MTAERPSIGRATVQAWRDTAETLGALGRPASIALLICLATGLLQRIAVPEQDFDSESLLAGFIVSSAQAFLLTPFLIAAYRFVVLREVTTRYELTPRTHRFHIFFLWSVAVSLLYWVPMFAFSRLFDRLPLPLLVAILLIVGVVLIAISLRAIILFPALAVDAPAATWGNAIADTKGNTWRIFFIVLLSGLPIATAAFLFLVVAERAGLMGEAQPPTSPFVGAILDGVLGVVGLTLAAAVASRLYEQLGDRVNGAPQA